ncbi:MAG: glycerol-3-phosphate 1-O-acyltransferase PlsY [Anaerolineae bacterium]
MVIVKYILIFAIAYLLGAFPTGYLVGRLAKGLDIRDYGSRRTGGTNVLRTVGFGAFSVTALVDVAKGALAVLLARWVLHLDVAEAVAGILAVLGHIYPVYIGWRGGRGVATGLGALFAISPVAALLVGLAWGLVALAFRYASLASLTLSSLTPFVLLAFILLFRQPIGYLLFGVAFAVIIDAVHYDNIRRLLAGTERKLGQKVSLEKDET